MYSPNIRFFGEYDHRWHTLSRGLRAGNHTRNLACIINNVYLQEGKAANIDVALQQAKEPVASEEKPTETEEKKPNLLDILGGIFKTSRVGGF